MSDYDYKGIFAADPEEGMGRNTPNFGIYQVSVVKRDDPDGKIFWSGEVEATSAKKAQGKWRIQYAHVRSKFDHSYALIIKRVSSL